ncbi:hypothetical protein NLI96_g9914 [Meripilus lineatus]|uniref:Uncharacterized protein n=1 Tax=Meripilus lineatus TaxID=2056292 RepID=A0AAD5UZT6_9APHY|nr:hypothetical protein NLI96_g9914 [Physisporinus lineatus]
MTTEDTQAQTQIRGRDSESQYVPLSLSDVYRWLESSGHFPRPAGDARPTKVITKSSAEKKPEQSGSGSSKPGSAYPSRGLTTSTSVKNEDSENVGAGSNLADSATCWYCRRCGSHYRFHPSQSQEDFIYGTGTSGVPHDSSPKLVDACTTTGVDTGLRVVVKEEPVVQTIPVRPDMSGVCMVFERSEGRVELPMVDVPSILDWARRGGGVGSKPSGRPVSHSMTIQHAKSSRLLVSLADPKLVFGIQRLASSWKISHFALALALPLPISDPLLISNGNGNFASSSTPVSNPSFPTRSRTVKLRDIEEGSNELVALDIPKTEMESQLGTSALLSLLVKPMAKLLIQSGVGIFRKDASAHGVWDRWIKAKQKSSMMRMSVSGTVQDSKGKKRRGGVEVVKDGDGDYRRILTASHVVRGLMDEGSAEADVRHSVLILLSRLGVAAAPAETEPKETRGAE